MELTNSKQVNRIVALLKRPSTITHVHLFGLNSSGASSAFHAAVDALEDSGSIVLSVNLLLVNGSVQNFCSEVLRKVMDMSLDLELELTKVKALPELFDVLSSILTESRHPLIIAINRAEQLVNFSNQFPIALFKCIKKENGKIKALTISQLLWSKIETTCLLSIPVQFSFKSFTKEQLLELLQKQLGKEKREIKLSIDLMYATCRDAKMLKHMIKGRDNLNKEKLLRSEMKNMVNYYAANDFSSKSCSGSPKVGANSLNLPLSEILMLIAAYCATYNTRNSDSRIFGTKKSRTQSEMAQRRKTAILEKIPKPFDLQRLHFIYLALLRYFNKTLYKESNIFILVNDLCLLGFLVKISADNNLDVPKYKCIASDELMMKAAQMVGESDLNNFLWIN